MSSPLAFLTVFESRDDLAVFSSRLLATFACDRNFQLLSSRPGFRWYLDNLTSTDLGGLQRRAAELGFVFTAGRPRRSGRRTVTVADPAERDSLYGRRAAQIGRRGFSVALIRPCWVFAGSTLLHLARALDQGGRSYGIPAIFGPLQDNETDPLGFVWRNAGVEPQATAEAYSSRSSVWWRVSRDHVVIKTPHCFAFYLTQADCAKPGRAEEIVRDPYALFDANPRAGSAHFGLGLVQRDGCLGGEPLDEADNPVRRIGSAELAEFCDGLCRRPRRRAAARGFLLGRGFLLSRENSLELLPEDRIAQVAFLNQLLLLRHRGFCRGLENPRMVVGLNGLSSVPMEFPRRKWSKPARLPKADAVRLDRQICTMTMDWYGKSFGWSMESMICQMILKRFQKYLPMVKNLMPDRPASIAIYGAGRHTELLLDLWRRLGGGPIAAVLVTKKPTVGEFQTIPMRRAGSCRDREFDVVVLSSATFEGEMARFCSQRFPNTPILSIWEERLTTLPPVGGRNGTR